MLKELIGTNHVPFLARPANHKPVPLESSITVHVDRALCLGGGRMPVRVFREASVAGLKRVIHRTLAIAPSTPTLLFHNKNSKMEGLDDDKQLLGSIGIFELSLLFVTHQGTLTDCFTSARRYSYRLCWNITCLHEHGY